MSWTRAGTKVFISACLVTPAEPDRTRSVLLDECISNEVYFLITVAHWLGPPMPEDPGEMTCGLINFCSERYANESFSVLCSYSHLRFLEEERFYYIPEKQSR